MSFDGNIVRHLTKEFNQSILTGRINKIYQLSKFDILLVINSKEGKRQLLISSSPSYSRIHLTEMKYEKPDKPPTFCMFLRKQIDNGIIKKIEQKENDRVITFTIEKRNELGDLSTKLLIVESMGRNSNIIVTDSNYKILESIKHQMPFDGSDRTVYPGAIYEFPFTSQINPYNTTDLYDYLTTPENTSLDMMKKNVMGFSPLVINELQYRLKDTKSDIRSILRDMKEELKPTFFINSKDHFYYFDLTHLEGDRQYFENINKLVDYYYYNRDRTDVIKQYSKTLIKFTRNYRTRLRNKIEKLTRNLNNTEKMDESKIKGELVLANIHNISKTDNELKCINYYTDQEVVIPLNNRLSPIQNSEKYFKKYKKMKTSIPHINKQIKEAKLEIKYFDQISLQIENGSLKDIEEIKDELMNKKYIKRSKTSKKRKTKPNYDTYFDLNGVEILVGKNNLQNAHITHKVAKHNDVWFHVKDAPGSHVVSRKSFPLDETTIRTCSQLAAYYSSSRNSSSVPVDYVEVRYIKKVPGKISSFVTYRNHKTIYIDPDKDFILSLIKK